MIEIFIMKALKPSMIFSKKLYHRVINTSIHKRLMDIVDRGILPASYFLTPLPSPNIDLQTPLLHFFPINSLKFA